MFIEIWVLIVVGFIVYEYGRRNGANAEARRQDAMHEAEQDAQTARDNMRGPLDW